MFVGIDAGSRATKLVGVNAAGDVVCRAHVDQSVKPAETARMLLDQALKGVPLTRCVSTGYARHLLPFADRAVTEITCHARGCMALHPDVDAILEIGGQDSKYIALESGRVADFMMNDRCAAGTGRFLETAAMRLALSLTEMEMPRKQGAVVSISSMCVVFAETEIIGLVSNNAAPIEIMRGVQHAIAQRVVAMMGERRSAMPNVVFTGGVAQVPGMRDAIEATLRCSVQVPEFPQYTGALGAALMAREMK